MEGLRERGAKVSALFRRRTSEVGRSRQHANAPRPRRKAALHIGEIYGFVGAIATSVFAGELALADSDPASRSSHRSTDKVRPSLALTPTSRLLSVGLHPRRRPGRSRNPLLPLEVSAAEDGRKPRLSLSRVSHDHRRASDAPTDAARAFPSPDLRQVLGSRDPGLARRGGGGGLLVLRGSLHDRQRAPPLDSLDRGRRLQVGGPAHAGTEENAGLVRDAHHPGQRPHLRQAAKKRLGDVCVRDRAINGSIDRSRPKTFSLYSISFMYAPSVW